MSNDNLPAGCTDRDTDGGVISQPTDEQVHAYVCENWRNIMDYVDHIGFISAEVDGCDDKSLEATDVFVTTRVRVPWVDMEA